MIATGSSPDAFQATSYLDLCSLKCSLPSSRLVSQWETAKSTLKALTAWKSHHSAVNLAVSQECKTTSAKVTKFAQFHWTTDKIQGLWDPKRTSIQQNMSWMWIIHNAQTAAIFAWALSFCKVQIERSGLLRSWSRALSGNIISTRKEGLNFCWKFLACSRCKSTGFQSRVASCNDTIFNLLMRFGTLKQKGGLNSNGLSNIGVDQT